MLSQQFLLTCLLFLNEGIGFKVHHINDKCVIMNSGTAIAICNRILHTGIPTIAEIDLIKSNYRGLPCTWPVDSSDVGVQKVLEENGFVDYGNFPAMAIDIVDIPSGCYDTAIAIEEISFESTKLVPWAHIITESFSYATGRQDEVFKMLKLLHEQVLPGRCSLYLAYYNGQPAAAGFLLIHGEVASLHLIATLAEFRNKGLGYAVTHALAVHAKNKGCKQAILLASALGRPVYERLGFKEFASYKIYGYGIN